MLCWSHRVGDDRRNVQLFKSWHFDPIAIITAPSSIQEYTSRCTTAVFITIRYMRHLYFHHIPAWLPSCVPEEWRSEPHTTACKEGCRRARCSSSPGSWFWPAHCWRHCRPHRWSWSSVCSLCTQKSGAISKGKFNWLTNIVLSKFKTATHVSWGNDLSQGHHYQHSHSVAELTSLSSWKEACNTYLKSK